jgi:hypothetical protein
MEMREGRGKSGIIPSEEVLAEADRLAGASGPKRTKGGAGAYTAVELMEAHRSLRAGKKTAPMPFDEPFDEPSESKALNTSDGNSG